MYNRYIPQSDGSHRRRTVPDGRPMPSQPRPAPPQPCGASPPIQNWTPSGSGFLKKLLPSGLDSGDLLVMVLLLLLAGDSQEEKNTALLTLALYLFL